MISGRFWSKVLLASGLLILFLTAHTSAVAEESPEEVVKAFYEKFLSGDQSAREFVSEASLKAFEDAIAFIELMTKTNQSKFVFDPSKVKYTTIEQKDNMAKVEVTGVMVLMTPDKKENEALNELFELRREKGVWKVVVKPM